MLKGDPELKHPTVPRRQGRRFYDPLTLQARCTQPWDAGRSLPDTVWGSEPHCRSKLVAFFCTPSQLLLTATPWLWTGGPEQGHCGAALCLGT